MRALLHLAALGFLCLLSCKIAVGLSDENEALVQKFRRYLANVEIEREEKARYERDLERQKRSADQEVQRHKRSAVPDLSRDTRSTLSSAKVIHNFGLFLDPEAAKRMCKSKIGSVEMSNKFLDKSPYCYYLQSHYNICENKTAVMQIGCQFTCEKCTKCDDDECKCSKFAVGRYVNGRYDCRRCQAGFQGDGRTCEDIDECREGTDECHKNAICTNLDKAEGGDAYRCTCKKGYSGDGKVACNDLNECTTGVHECDKDHATCSNTEGSYKCTCHERYEGDGKFCTPINYCTTEKHDCGENAICLRQPVGFVCRCRKGYEDTVPGLPNDKKGRNCQDIDECKRGLHSCDIDATCTNTQGSYNCTCNEGYEGDGSRCTKTDPCSPSECDTNAKCIPDHANERYDCKCNTGYESISAIEGRVCKDIDECIKSTHDCDANAYCTNTDGSYTCTCKPGFSGSGKQCQDIDECTTRTHKCVGNAYCVNTIGSYFCDCPLGYTLSNSYQCADINECLRSPGPCHHNGTCQNTKGSYTCGCNKGYEGNGFSCKDVNECDRENECHTWANCRNTIGSYTCHCKGGYRGSGRSCSDINECKETPEVCHTNADCTNSNGSYVCDCKEGYSGDGVKNCENINECARGEDDCDHLYGICTDTVGSYRCTCKPGYSGDGVSCSDIDECEEGHNCHEDYGNCTNTMGSFKCSCKVGFVGDGVNCTDKNECKDGSAVYKEHAYCVNVLGSYNCKCDVGFESPSDPCQRCDDINECLRGTDNCDENAICKNTVGSCTCTCKDGFQGNGQHCEDIDECKTGTAVCMDHSECKNTIGSYKCNCIKGYVFNSKTGTCDDVDECLTGADNCHSTYGICTNTIGSFICRCKTGFEGDGVTCRDIDECDRKLYNCHQKYSTCTNTIGSFTCACNKGFRGDGVKCGDINECKEDTHNCHRPHAQCTNTVGSFKCTCKPGFTGDGWKCTKVPVCKSKLDPCSKYADCSEDMNKAGAECDCKFGFFGDGQKCTGSRGYEFMFLFMQNIRAYSDTPTSQLFTQMYLAADKGGELTISTSSKLDSTIKREMDKKVTLSAGINSVNMSKEIRMSKDQAVERKGIHVKSNQLITLFALNHEDYTSDSMLVLPMDRLGTRYFIPSSQPHESYEDYQSQIGVVATEDNTKVTIQLKIRDPNSKVTYKGKKYGDGQFLDVTLAKYDTFQVSHSSDLTGTIVSSNKPVGVVSGNRCNQLRHSPFAFCSHLVEMIPPVESWDKTYIVPPHYGHEGSLVRILASKNTDVTVRMGSETKKDSLTVSGYVDKKPNATTPLVVEANNPVQVLSFAKGGGRDTDPYFTMSQGLNQFVHEYNFAVPYHFDSNFIAVTVESAKASQLRLDGKPLTSAQHSVSVAIGGKSYVIATYAISEGSHKIITKDESRFGLMIFGDREYDGYGYPGNMLVEGKL